MVKGLLTLPGRGRAFGDYTVLFFHLFPVLASLRLPYPLTTWTDKVRKGIKLHPEVRCPDPKTNHSDTEGCAVAKAWLLLSDVAVLKWPVSVQDKENTTMKVSVWGKLPPINVKALGKGISKPVVRGNERHMIKYEFTYNFLYSQQMMCLKESRSTVLLAICP